MDDSKQCDQLHRGSDLVKEADMLDEKRRREWERVKAQSTALLAKQTPQPSAPPQPREPRLYYEDDSFEAWERRQPPRIAHSGDQ
jgi:hypothetical protein